MSEAEGDSTGAQGLIFSELNSSFGPDLDALKSDHCDLLLDAMDKQLDQLQIHSQSTSRRFRENISRETVSYGWSQSVSKDTGLGSTQTDTPLSCQDLQSPVEHMSETSTGFKDNPGDRQLACVNSRDRAVQESHQEEALWRLHRLLGDSCQDTGSPQPLSDSICTEDFSRRFSQEMVHEPAAHKKYGASTGGAKALPKAKHRDSQEKRGAGLRCSSPKRHTDDGHNTLRTLPSHVKPPQMSTSTPKQKCVAGVPVLSFDSVSIDSDLDSVCTERLRQHIHKQPGWHSFMESVRNLDELWNGHRGNNTVTLQETELLTHPDSENQHGTPHLREESTRPLVDDERDLEENTPWMQSECTSLRERLCSLQQKCLEEETLLKVRRAQLSEEVRSLTKLQQNKQEAVRKMAQLTAQTGLLEQERKGLESLLRQIKAEKDSVRQDLQILQRQRESAHQPAAYRAVDVSDKRSDVVLMSVLERDEMQRQLTSAKSELFSEQQRARDKLEAVQERLEEAHEELQKATDSESSLRDKCLSLEEQHRHRSHTFQALESQVCELHRALEGSQLTVGTLEKILSEKELQLLELQRLHREVESHRDQSEGQLQQLKTQHYSALREAREQAHCALQTALHQQKKDLDLIHQRDIHKLKEEEAKKCKEELEREVLKKVQAAVEEERSRREAEQQEDVSAHSRLEQLHRDTEERLNSRIQQEKDKAQALHSKLRELHTEQQRAAVELKQAETEVNRLRRTLEEQEKAHSQSSAEGHLRASQWALELLTEVSHLQELVQNNQSKTGLQNNASPTVEQALSSLSSVRQQVQGFTHSLQRELHSLQLSTDKMHTEKERELSVQRQHLRREREHALDALKERLIQQHVEELSCLQRDGSTEELLACLRSQLRAKDTELKQVQRSMAQWKEHTAHRMACKFEEELTAELERCKAKVLKSRNVLKAPEHVKGPVVSKEDLAPVEKACPLSAVRSVVDCSSDTASLKLLCHLQSRVRQLRRDHQSYSPSSRSAPAHSCTEEAEVEASGNRQHCS